PIIDRKDRNRGGAGGLPGGRICRGNGDGHLAGFAGADLVRNRIEENGVKLRRHLEGCPGERELLRLKTWPLLPCRTEGDVDPDSLVARTTLVGIAHGHVGEEQNTSLVVIERSRKVSRNGRGIRPGRDGQSEYLASAAAIAVADRHRNGAGPVFVAG